MCFADSEKEWIEINYKDNFLFYCIVIGNCFENKMIGIKINFNIIFLFRLGEENL